MPASLWCAISDDALASRRPRPALQGLERASVTRISVGASFTHTSLPGRSALRNLGATNEGEPDTG